MSTEVEIVAQHPTLPFGFDASGVLWRKRVVRGGTRRWCMAVVREKRGWRFVCAERSGRQRKIGVETIRRDCGLESYHDWDEHEELRLVRLRYCECCGRPKNTKTKSICWECARMWKRSSLSPQTCDLCGKAYQGHNRKYCGGECRQKAHHERLKMTTVERICKVCEMEFRTSKWKRSVCCSTECANAWRARRQADWPVVEGECMRCKEPFRRRVHYVKVEVQSRYCSTQCLKRDQQAANLRGCRKRGRKDLRPLLSTIGARDGWVCQLCGEPVDARIIAPDKRCASIDHIIPLSRGGTNDAVNLQLAHYGCNSRKGNRSNHMEGAVSEK